jgi:hypothetical protein
MALAGPRWLICCQRYDAKANSHLSLRRKATISVVGKLRVPQPRERRSRAERACRLRADGVARRGLHSESACYLHRSQIAQNITILLEFILTNLVSFEESGGLSLSPKMVWSVSDAGVVTASGGRTCDCRDSAE